MPPRKAPDLAQQRLRCVRDPLVLAQQGGPLKGSPEQVRSPPHADLVLKERKGSEAESGGVNRWRDMSCARL